MSTPSPGSAGNGTGGERFDVHEDLGSMSEIQQQLTVMSRQLGQLASRFTDSQRQRAEEAAIALLFKQPRKPKKSGERERKYKSGKLACLPYRQFRSHWRGGQLLLLL